MPRRKKPQLVIDISDWDALWQAVQEKTGIERIENTEHAIQIQYELGLNSGTMGTILIAARERGLAPPGILQTPKGIMLLGAVLDWQREIRKQVREITLPNGKVILIRAWVLSTPDERSESGEFLYPSDYEGWEQMAKSGTALAMERAESYILNHNIRVVTSRFEQLVSDDPGRALVVLDQYIAKLTETLQAMM